MDEDYTWPGLVKSSSMPGDADAGFPRQERVIVEPLVSLHQTGATGIDWIEVGCQMNMLDCVIGSEFRESTRMYTLSEYIALVPRTLVCDVGSTAIASLRWIYPEHYGGQAET